MRRVLKYLLYALGIVVVLALCFVGYYAMKWPPKFPDAPLPDIEASDDPTVVARGAYLVNAVAHCSACHSPIDEYTGAKPGEVVAPKGGHEWHMGPLGTIRSANITPDDETGIGKVSDGHVARAIRHGVRADDVGALFMMSVGPMSDEDLTAIVSYLRSIPGVKNDVADHEIGIMGKVLFQTAMGFFAEPHDYDRIMPEFVKESDTPSVGRGKYLAEGPGFCAGCHSDYEYDEQIEFVGQLNSGNKQGFVDEADPDFSYYAPNLTPQEGTGQIADWTEEQFLARMKQGRVYATSPMPWESYWNMTDADLKSIWMYLRQLPPTEKDIGESRRKGD